MPNQKKKTARVEILVAIVALIGVIVTGLFTNWDKIFSKEKGSEKVTLSISDSLSNQKANEISIYIIGQTYRRAFSLNFQTRFVNGDEYIAVLKSINEAHGEIQAKYVLLQSLDKPQISNIAYNMLRKLDIMETTFKKMQPYIKDTVFSKGYLPRRLDGTGPPELTKAYQDMESIRLQFLEDIRQLADKQNISLLDVPAEN
ncbi:hypothetical protein [Lunatibacter salilacus]|uniref:hypothetical protein n=1 Tax=Lunatibacter salilacus TaxID=2483804 RepID=UPI00131B04BB|nr:hypothetical protein [Lunatibacter salilacus]